MTQPPIAGIILAAGKGTRMKSDLPKGLHELCGVPMVELVGRAMLQAGFSKVIIVVGHGGEEIIAKLGDRFSYAWQREQLGTGHAALMARPELEGHQGPVVIAPGDAPLVTAEVFRDLVSAHQGHLATIATAIQPEPKGYGRIFRNATGQPTRIIEERDANAEQKRIQEVNTGIYCFDGPTLLKTLPTLKNDNDQKEYLLTDVIEAVVNQRGSVGAVVFEDRDIVVGVNDRWQLALAESTLRQRILRKHAEAGVTLRDPATTYVGLDVEIGVDSEIEACTQLVGSTKVGKGCRLGPNTRIVDSEIGDRTFIWSSVVKESKIGSHVTVGPFAHIRPNSSLGDEVRIGNFVEINRSTLEDEVKASHLTYVGDSHVGERTNIGAGTITCNYDGFQKHRTQIGEDCFIGSSSTLVAPVTIGDGAMVAAGSVITHDVPADAGAFGRARQETKEGWAAKWRTLKATSQKEPK